jgi:phosphoesterase RecJ-like protein
VNVKTNSATPAVIMPVDEIKEVVTRARRILVVSHIDPDGDAIGTQLAFGAYLRDQGKDVVMTRDGAVPGKYLFLQGVDQLVVASTLAAGSTFDTVVILECPSMQRLGNAARFLRKDTAIINIDHHPDNNLNATVSWLDRTISSVGEMAYEYFRAVGYRLSSATAECLYTAILTDTGRFRFSSTSPRTMTVAGELIAAGAEPRKICDLVYFSMLPSTITLIGKVLNGIEFHLGGKICLLPLTRQMLNESGAHESETDGLVDYAMFSKGVMAGLLVRELDGGRCKVSLRSINGVDVSRIADKFGGGGHFNAAGCIVDRPLAATKVLMIELLTEASNALG